MTDALEPEEQREQELRQEYGWLYDQLCEIFFAADPAHLAMLGSPKDEYSVEVDAFLPLLKDIHSLIDLSQVLYDVFVAMFSEKMMCSQRAIFAPLAEAVWRAYRHWQNEKGLQPSSERA